MYSLVVTRVCIVNVAIRAELSQLLLYESNESIGKKEKKPSSPRRRRQGVCCGS